MQKYQNMALLFINLGIFVFLQKFTITQIRGSSLERWEMFLKIQTQKYPNKVFLVLNLGKILQLDKLEGANLKDDNSFLKFQPKNTRIRHFW